MINTIRYKQTICNDEEVLVVDWVEGAFAELCEDVTLLLARLCHIALSAARSD